MPQREWIVKSGADLGRAIAEVRTSRGLTQEQAALRGGVSRPYLSKIEGGRTVSLLEHELRLLRRLGATVTVTFGESDGA